MMMDTKPRIPTEVKVKESQKFLQMTQICSTLYKELAQTLLDAHLNMEDFINSKDGDYAHLAEAHDALKAAAKNIEKNTKIVEGCMKAFGEFDG